MCSIVQLICRRQNVYFCISIASRRQNKTCVQVFSDKFHSRRHVKSQIAAPKTKDSKRKKHNKKEVNGNTNIIPIDPLKSQPEKLRDEIVEANKNKVINYIGLMGTPVH